MAQTLKEDVRLSIINAAKQEFLEKGYKGASMRSIANKANMTVGNLYRYYKNKEDINLSIVAPTFRSIDSAIKVLNVYSGDGEPRVFNLKPDINDVVSNFNKFADSLVDIYFSNMTEFNILILHSRISEEMIKKFFVVINDIISEPFVFNNLTSDKEILIKAYSESLFSGMKSIFKQNVNDEIALKDLLKTYFRSFINMLNSDIKQSNE